MSSNVVDWRRTRHVLWDWNGTLLDDAWLCVDVMDRMLQARGLPRLDSARYQTVFSFPVRSYYERLGFDFARERWEAVGTEFIDGYQERQHECALQAGARAALSAIGARGLPQAVLSASERRRLHQQAGRLGVLEHFVQLLGLDDHYAGGKVELGRGWVAALEHRPDEVLLVGDTDHDAEVARALGIRCVLVPSGHQSPERLRACGWPVLGSLEELAQ